MSLKTDTTDSLKAIRQRRVNDPERTRANILAVATEEFAAHGLSGARVDAIAERTRTSKRMIYYYFASKEGLYLAVLEQAYSEIRALEASLDLSALDPEAAIRALVETTFDYDDAHPDFVRLVGIENIHRAEHIARSQVIRDLNITVIGSITEVLRRGRESGCFRADNRGRRPAYAHQFLLLLPRRQPAHVRIDFRGRSRRSGRAGSPQAADRRRGSALPRRSVSALRGTRSL